MARRDREYEPDDQDDLDDQANGEMPDSEYEDQEPEAESDAVEEEPVAESDEMGELGLSREVKIGLAGILVLLVVFGTVLYGRLTSQDPADEGTAKQEGKADPKTSPKPAAATPAKLPDVVSTKPAAPAAKRSSVTDMANWSLPGSPNARAKSADASAPPAISYMPRVSPPGLPAGEAKAGDDPFKHTGDASAAADPASVPATPPTSTFTPSTPDWRTTPDVAASASPKSEHAVSPGLKPDRPSTAGWDPAPATSTLGQVPPARPAGPSASEPPSLPPLDETPRPAASRPWGATQPDAGWGAASRSTPPREPAAAIPPLGPAKTDAATESPAPGRTYVVRDGDTLLDIARRQLGKGTRWVEIYDLNSEVLGDHPDRLRAGMKLVLPEDRTSALFGDRPGLYVR